MAGELQVVGPGTGLTIYAVLHDHSAQVWYPTGSTFETYNAAHWTNYAIALTEQGASGFYAGTMPSCPAGLVNIDYRQRVGGSAAVSDPCVGSGTTAWNGTVEMSTASKLLNDETQVLAGSPTAGSFYDLMLRAAAHGSAFSLSGTVATFSLPGGRTVTLTVDNAGAPTTGAVSVS